MDVIASIGRSGYLGGLDLTRQWDSIVAGGPQGGITAGDLVRVAGLGLADMEASVVDLHQGLDGFFYRVLFVIEGIRVFLGGRLGILGGSFHTSLSVASA